MGIKSHRGDLIDSDPKWLETEFYIKISTSPTGGTLVVIKSPRGDLVQIDSKSLESCSYTIMPNKSHRGDLNKPDECRIGGWCKGVVRPDEMNIISQVKISWRCGSAHPSGLEEKVPGCRCGQTEICSKRGCVAG